MNHHSPSAISRQAFVRASQNDEGVNSERIGEHVELAQRNVSVSFEVSVQRGTRDTGSLNGLSDCETGCRDLGAKLRCDCGYIPVGLIHDADCILTADETKIHIDETERLRLLKSGDTVIRMDESIASEPSARNIGRRIRISLLDAGISANELARQTGIPSASLYRKLAGTAEFRASELVKISRALGIGLEDLAYGASDPVRAVA